MASTAQRTGDSRSGRKKKIKPSEKSSWRRIRNHFKEEWDSFLDDVSTALEDSMSRRLDGKLSRYDCPVSILKRMTYNFIIQNRDAKILSQIKTAIYVHRKMISSFNEDHDEFKKRSIRKVYSDNPFYWVLSGLQSAIEPDYVKIEKHDISRFSQQLLYADRHNIPPEFLIGFLYQSGTISEICQKAKDPNHREDWFIALGRNQPTDDDHSLSSKAEARAEHRRWASGPAR